MYHVAAQGFGINSSKIIRDWLAAKMVYDLTFWQGAAGFEQQLAVYTG
jgi:hypothetical protein